MRNRQTLSIGYFLIAVAVLFGMQTLFAPKADEMSYSDFRKAVAADKVDEVLISETLIRGTMKPEKKGDKPEPFVTVPVKDDQLVSELEKHGVLYLRDSSKMAMASAREPAIGLSINTNLPAFKTGIT